MVPSRSRRRVLRAVGGLALASVAGCLGDEHVDPGARTTVDETTAPAATAESSATETRTASETTRRYLTSFPPDERLLLRASAAVTVSVEMYESESKETPLAAETYALDAGETVEVTEFDPRGWITVTVEGPTTTAATADGAVAPAGPGWEGYVGTASRYELAVAADGSVEVASYSEK